MLTTLGCTEGVLSGEGEVIGITGRRSTLEENGLLKKYCIGLFKFAVPLRSALDRDCEGINLSVPWVRVVGNGAPVGTSETA